LISPEYLAGFVDGEGYTGLAKICRRGRSPEYCLRIAIYNSHRGALDAIQTTWGGVMSEVGQRKPGWKPGYALIWTNASAALVLEKIAPFLILKARQAGAMLRFQRRIHRLARVRDARGHLAPLPIDESKIREAMYRRVKRMNARATRIKPQRNRSNVSSKLDVSAPYLAGFVDGEGSLMLARWEARRYPNPVYRPRVSITNTDRRVLDAIQHCYGGILTSESRAKFGWNHSYQLVWTAGLVERIVKTIEPYLLIKHKQAEILLRYIRHKDEAHQGRQGTNGRFFAPLSRQVIAYRQRLWLEIRAINARGVDRHRDSAGSGFKGQKGSTRTE
jgi:LAGLIDADG DNA endonuclease family protein